MDADRTPAPPYAAEIRKRYPAATYTRDGAWVGSEGRAGFYAQARAAGMSPAAAAKLVSAAGF